MSEIVFGIVAKVAFFVCCGLLAHMVIMGIREPRKFQEGWVYMVTASFGAFVVSLVAF